MSEPGPESVPTSKDPRSQRALKRRALTPVSRHANQLEALFANPDREIKLPDAESLRPKGVAPPPEIVANVQGSSAGAGSGEFHVYKASRRREYERLKAMEEEVQREKDKEEFSQSREENKEKEEKRMGKNKARREKAKERKANKGKASGGREETKVEKVKEKAKVEVRKLLGNKEDDDEEADTQGAVAKPDGIGLVIHDDD